MARSVRMVIALVFGMMLISCATADSQRIATKAPVGAGTVPRQEIELSTAELPAGSITIGGDDRVLLRVIDDGGLLRIERSDEASSNLSFKFMERGADRTMVSSTSAFGHPLKLDFYISPDGERWFYTSSCVVPTYEMWPHALAGLVVANPRLAPEGKGSICD